MRLFHRESPEDKREVERKVEEIERRITRVEAQVRALRTAGQVQVRRKLA